MDDKRHLKEWSVVLFGLFLLVFMPPFLSVYDLPAMVLGMPLSYFVLFGMWGVLIAAVALSTRPARDKASDRNGETDAFTTNEDGV